MEINKRIFSFIIKTSDLTNPYIKNDMLSYGLCKPIVRSSCKVGDWIIGIISSTNKKYPNHISFIFEVNEKDADIDRLFSSLIIREKLLSYKFSSSATPVTFRT